MTFFVKVLFQVFFLVILFWIKDYYCDGFQIKLHICWQVYLCWSIKNIKYIFLVLIFPSLQLSLIIYLSLQWIKYSECLKITLPSNPNSINNNNKKIPKNNKMKNYLSELAGKTIHLKTIHCLMVEITVVWKSDFLLCILKEYGFKWNIKVFWKKCFFTTKLWKRMRKTFKSSETVI